MNFVKTPANDTFMAIDAINSLNRRNHQTVPVIQPVFNMEDREKGKRRSSRKRQKTDFFEFPMQPKKRRAPTMNDEDFDNSSDSDSDEFLTPEEKREEERENNVEHVVEVLENVLKKTFYYCDLESAREGTRARALKRNLENAEQLESKVYPNGTNGGYFVSSSDGVTTYSVEPKAFGEKVKFVCNCGERFSAGERTMCKHIGAVILHHLNQYTSDFMEKQYKPNVQLQLHHMGKSLGKIDIGERKDKDEKLAKLFADNVFNEFSDNRTIPENMSVLGFLMEENKKALL